MSDLSPENIQARSGELLDVCRAYGLAMPVFASACTADDHEQIDLLAEGAASCGCPAIRLSCPRGYDGSVGYHELYDEAVRAFQGALAITRPRGIKVLIETHGGTIHLSASLAYRLVSNFDPEDIGVIYDPQNMVKDGFETTKLALDMLGGYLAHLHVGGHRPEPGPVDDRGTQQWIWRAVPMGMGLYDYPELIRALKAVGYRGFVSIEDFATDRSAEAKLKDGIRYLRSL